MKGDCGRSTAAPKLSSLLVPLFMAPLILALNPGTIHVDSDKGGDYCFLFPSQWMLLYKGSGPKQPDPGPPTRNLPYSAMCCLPSFFGEADSDGGGLSMRIASVRKGDCNLYENAKLQPINETQGLLTLGGDAPFPTPSWKSGYRWGRCEEITLPGVLLSDRDILGLLLKNLTRDFLYRTGLIYLMSMTIVTTGSYWAGSDERRKKQYIESPHQAEVELDEITVDRDLHVTRTCILTATFVLLVFYCFYHYWSHAVIGIFCLYASFSLYSCLTPFVHHMPFGRHTLHVTYFQKDLEIRRLLLAGLCLSVGATWVVFRNDTKWGWVLQDALGISIGIFVLRSIRMPTLRTCSLFLFAHLFYDVLSLLLSSSPTKTERRGAGMAAFASSRLEGIPFLLKVPMLSAALDPDGCSFTAVSLGDIVLPGLLVAYCHRFDVQIETPGVYFLASVLAYSYGLLVTFMAATFFQASQSTLPYLVPCILFTSLAIAARRKEAVVFWMGVSAADDTSEPSSSTVISCTGKLNDLEIQQSGGGSKPALNWRRRAFAASAFPEKSYLT